MKSLINSGDYSLAVIWNNLVEMCVADQNTELSSVHLRFCVLCHINAGKITVLFIFDAVVKLVNMVMKRVQVTFNSNSIA